MADEQTAVRLAEQQLGRMRAMTALYHRRFFADVRLSLLLILGLLVLSGADGWRHAVLPVPFIALFGAVQTAFDASYLIFARHFAARLEAFLNQAAGRDILVGARLEDAYLFPLEARKVVTLTVRPFSWFGFMTGFFTIGGAGAYVLGAVLAVGALSAPALVWYLASLGVLTAAALGVGFWWFVGGEGERRLTAVLDGSALPPV